MGGALSLFGDEFGRPDTSEIELKGSSGEVSGVRKIPRLVVEAALIREVGLLVEGEGGNSSNKSDILMETPRLVGGAALIQEVGFHADGEGGNLSSGSGGEPRLVVLLFL